MVGRREKRKERITKRDVELVDLVGVWFLYTDLPHTESTYPVAFGHYYPRIENRVHSYSVKREWPGPATVLALGPAWSLVRS